MEACLVIEEKHENSDRVAFTNSRKKFEQIVGELQSEDTFQQTHSQLEERLETDGRELLRQLMQEHYELRSARELRQTGGVTGSDGVNRNQVRKSERDLKTIFGEARIERLSYSAKGHESLKPIDGELNLPKEVHSFGLQRRLAQEAAKNSFEEAIESVKATTGMQIGKRQAETLVVEAAKDFDAFYGFGSMQAKVMLKSVFGGKEITPAAGVNLSQFLILTTDGKGIVVLEKDLREATRKAAAKRKNHREKKHQLRKAEKKHKKRMAQVASVYTIDPFVRTPEDIVRDLRYLQPVTNSPLRRPRPQDKRVWASVIKDAEVVIEEAFIEGLRRDPARQMQCGILVDGNEDQLRIINEMSKQYRLQSTIILDFIHVSEYVWKASSAFNKKGSIKADKWVTKRLQSILRGESSQVAEEIRHSITQRKSCGKKYELAMKCVTYLCKNAPYLQYHEYLKKGFPIASGVIEGACRHLIKDRLDITGARWTIEKAEAILKLRSLRSSGDFESYWNFHEEQEFQRNHLSNYADLTIPKTHHVNMSLRLVKV